MSDFQSAYRPHHSTETALLKVTNDLLFAMDEGKVSVLLLLDLSSAFDTTDHEIMLHRLHHVFRFGDTVLSWFQSYLEKGTQIVTIHDINTRFQLLFVTTWISSWTNTFYSIPTASIKCHTTFSFTSSVCR